MTQNLDQVTIGDTTMPKSLRDYYAFRWMTYKKSLIKSRNKYIKTNKGKKALAKSAARQLQIRQGSYLCTCGKEVKCYRKNEHENTLYHKKWNNEIIIGDGVSQKKLKVNNQVV